MDIQQWIKVKNSDFYHFWYIYQDQEEYDHDPTSAKFLYNKFLII